MTDDKDNGCYDCAGLTAQEEKKYRVSVPTRVGNGRFSIQYLKIDKKRCPLMFSSLLSRCTRWMRLLPPLIPGADNGKRFRKKAETLEKLDLPSSADR